MKKSLFITLLLLPFLWSCEQDITDRKPVVRTFEQDGFRFTFSLQTEDGTNATVFKEGEKMLPVYKVENLNADTAYIAESYADPRNYDTGFFNVYAASNNSEIAYITMDVLAIVKPCLHITPSGVVEYTVSPSAIQKSLGKGSYYVAFTPRFAYYSSCCHYSDSEGLDERINIEMPEFKINFEVK